jgi:LysM repeat protein
MARHPFSPRAGRRNRNRLYTILLAVLAIGVLIAFYYGPFGKNEAGPIKSENPDDTNVNTTAADKSEVPNEPKIREPVVAKKTDVEVNEPAAFVPPAEPEKKPELPQVTQEPAPGPTVQANPEAATLIAEAKALLDEKPGKIIQARDKFNQSLRMPMSREQRLAVKNQLSELADQWLFSRTVVPEDPLCASYQVKFRDTLENIGKEFKVPYEILMKINRISDPRSLQAGLPIKVIKGPFNAKIYRSTFTMDVYLQNTFVRSFRVGLGKDDTETPTGIWRVKADGKLVEPPWPDPVTGRIIYPGDPAYALGSRWIGLEGLSGEAKDRTGFGIHGTKDPRTIGTASSQGCIRMHNGDAILIYNMLFPVFSQVEIAD